MSHKIALDASKLSRETCMQRNGQHFACQYSPCMSRKKAPAGSLLKRGLGVNYITQWRKYRDLTQDRLVDRVAELLDTSFTSATLSRIENSKSPYSQRQLEAIAEALDCTPADLLMRNPGKPEAAWNLLESLKPETRVRALDLIKLMKMQDDQAA